MTGPGVIAVRAMEAADGPGVLAIYGEGIATGHATFEVRAPAWIAWDGAHLPRCRLVAERAGELVGWAALAPVSARPVYAGVAEVSVYVASRARGTGAGRRLLEGLVEASETVGMWTLQAGIFPENTASIRLHERLGFRVVGVRERLGRMSYGPLAGRWRDVVLLERRSRAVGEDGER